ncbi:histone-lysine N-methyltransferase SETMAR [Trichonephila clavipes]|nr:histone-lysine N-methyltransferase SETMAR [Trichonephila clavipes]
MVSLPVPIDDVVSQVFLESCASEQVFAIHPGTAVERARLFSSQTSQWKYTSKKSCPVFSPDLTPSDFHLFLHLTSFLAGKHFNNDKELKKNVSNWLKTQAATIYEEGIEKLVPRYDTCLQNFGSYVERSEILSLRNQLSSKTHLNYEAFLKTFSNIKSRVEAIDKEVSFPIFCSVLFSSVALYILLNTSLNPTTRQSFKFIELAIFFIVFTINFVAPTVMATMVYEASREMASAARSFVASTIPSAIASAKSYYDLCLRNDTINFLPSHQYQIGTFIVSNSTIIQNDSELRGILKAFSCIKSRAEAIDKEVSFLIFCSIIHTSSTMYCLLHTAFDPDYINSQKLIELILFFLSSTAIFLITTVSASLVGEASQEIASTVRSLSVPSVAAGLSLQRFLLVVEKDICLTVWKIVPIKRNFIIGTMGAIVTYSVLFHGLNV